MIKCIQYHIRLYELTSCEPCQSFVMSSKIAILDCEISSNFTTAIKQNGRKSIWDVFEALVVPVSRALAGTLIIAVSVHFS